MLNGWLLSGDVGIVLPNGALKIVDRVKNIFKLSYGEYVAPEKLENVYIQSEWVEQVWIYGDPMHDYILAFVACAEGRIKKWCKESGKTFEEETKEALMSDEGLRTLVFEDLCNLASQNNLSTLEKPG